MVKSLSVLLAIVALGVFTTDALACHGACCLPDGTCEEGVEISECAALGGDFYENTSCADVVCIGCRVTGGGVDLSGSWDGTKAKGSFGRHRYTFGGQAGAPTGAPPQPAGEWTHHNKNSGWTFVFHAGTASAPPETEIDVIECSDPGFCSPARPAPTKQIDFAGVGTFKNSRGHNEPDGVMPGESLHWFEVHIEDLGEPGKGGKQDPPEEYCPPEGSPGAVADCDCPDYYAITIHAEMDPGSPVIYEVHGYIFGGNLQIHPSLD